MQTLLDSIRNGFACCQGVEFTEEDAHKILSRIPTNVENLAYYAFAAGRNAAIDKIRREKSEQKKEQSLIAKETEQMWSDLAQENYERDRKIAKSEFLYICENILPSLRQPATQINNLVIVGLTCFDGLGDAECAEHFPGTNNNLRYKWKERGINTIVPYASDFLRKFLGRPS